MERPKTFKTQARIESQIPYFSQKYHFYSLLTSRIVRISIKQLNFVSEKDDRKASVQLKIKMLV